MESLKILPEGFGGHCKSLKICPERLRQLGKSLENLAERFSGLLKSLKIESERLRQARKSLDNCPKRCVYNGYQSKV